MTLSVLILFQNPLKATSTTNPSENMRRMGHPNSLLQNMWWSLYVVRLGAGRQGRYCSSCTTLASGVQEAGSFDYAIDNPGMIGVTQPRRVAAISMAACVASELSLSTSCISYRSGTML
ncbi:hypothetical protein JB92DRAFT_3098983, partial [Gautieria morchelliformis]